MKFPRCVVERISMKYGRNLGAFGTKERNEIWAEVGRNSGLRQYPPHECNQLNACSLSDSTVSAYF